MVSKFDGSMYAKSLRRTRENPTEDKRDDESLDVLGAGLVGISGKVGNVQT